MISPSHIVTNAVSLINGTYSSGSGSVLSIGLVFVLASSLFFCLSFHLLCVRRVLQFLIPVKLLLGKLPNTQLLVKYRLTQFAGLMEAMKTGNLKKFNDSNASDYYYYYYFLFFHTTAPPRRSVDTC